jgi:hypothetical protein
MDFVLVGESTWSGAGDTSIIVAGLGIFTDLELGISLTSSGGNSFLRNASSGSGGIWVGFSTSGSGACCSCGIGAFLIFFFVILTSYFFIVNMIVS